MKDQIWRCSMNQHCEVIRDLMPLYVDQICSEDTCILIENHLRECPQCRQALEQLRYSAQEECEQRIEDKELARRVMKMARRRAYMRTTIGLILMLVVVFFMVLTVNEVASRNQFPQLWSFTGIDMQVKAEKVAKLLKNEEVDRLVETYLDADVLYEMHQDVLQKLDAAEAAGDVETYIPVITPEEIRAYSEAMLAMGKDEYTAFCQQTLKQALGLFAEQDITITKYNARMEGNALYISMQLRDDSGDKEYTELDNPENIYALYIEYEDGTIQDISGHAESGELMKRFVKEKGIGFEEVPSLANPWRHAYVVTGITY